MSKSVTRFPVAAVSRDLGLPTGLECVWRAVGVDDSWVSVAGDLDLATVSLLIQAVRAAGHVVLLDTRSLTFLDIAGVRAMAELSTRARAAGDRLLVLRGSGRMQRMLFALPGLAPLIETVSLDPPGLPAFSSALIDGKLHFY